VESISYLLKWSEDNSMVERLSANFHVLPVRQVTGVPWRDLRLSSAVGYSELASQFSDPSPRTSLPRPSRPTRRVAVHSAMTGLAASSRWTRHGLRTETLSCCWWSLGPGRSLRCRFPALAARFFAAWAHANPGQVPLDSGECAGYQVPPFLGGKDTIDNLEVINLEVYWSLCGQLRLGIKRLPTGTTIRQVSIDD
jgi:hypothetical protein